MCESSVWVRHPDGRTEKIADDILIAQQDGPDVILRGLLSETLRVAGMLQEIDSLKHTITLMTSSDAGVRASLTPTHAPVETRSKAKDTSLADVHLDHLHRHVRTESPVVEWEFTRTNG